MLLFSNVLHAIPQQSETLRTIRLSRSASLIIKLVKVPAAVPKGTPSQLPPGFVLLDPSNPLAKAVNKTYIVVFSVGGKEVKLDQLEFRDVPATGADSTAPRFAVYGAALDGENLHYLFVNKGKILLATAHVDGSGNISNYHQRELPAAFERVGVASFTKYQNGKITLEVSEPGKSARAFQFDRNGEVVAVPAEVEK